jgi:hypothetical protein
MMYLHGLLLRLAPWVLVIQAQQLMSQATVLQTDLCDGSMRSHRLVEHYRHNSICLQTDSGAAMRNSYWRFCVGSDSIPDDRQTWAAPDTGYILRTFNERIEPDTGCCYSGARYQGNDGVPARFPTLKDHHYYTVNISKSSQPTNPQNEILAVLETNYCPRKIKAFQMLSDTLIGTENNGNFRIQLNGNPDRHEHFYLHTDTNQNFQYGVLTRIQVTDSTGYVFSPCLSAPGRVYARVFSSPLTQPLLDTALQYFSAEGIDLLSLEQGPADLAYRVDTINGMAGNYVVPGPCYSSIASFVDALNNRTLLGPVSLHVLSRHTETAPGPSGIALTATGTASKPIRISHFGTGPKPLIYAATGTRGLNSSSTAVDGIFSLHGSDYITIQGIDLLDTNSHLSGVARMEYGYALFKTGATDGCQHVRISNCRITARAVMPSTGPAAFEDGNKGIVLANTTANAINQSLPITSISGLHAADTFDSDTIVRYFSGILVKGFTDNSNPWLYIDSQIVIGLPGSGNSIEYFGEEAIKIMNARNCNVQHNDIHTNPDGNAPIAVSASERFGILFTSTNNYSNAGIRISNNRISITAAAGSGSQNTFGIIARQNSGNGNRVEITDNELFGFRNNAGTGLIYAIRNTGIRNELFISGNRIHSNRTNALSNGNLAMYAISNAGNIGGIARIINNQIFGDTAYGTYTAIYNSGLCSDLRIAYNKVGGILDSSIIQQNTQARITGIGNVSISTGITIDSNQINGLRTTGSVYGISSNTQNAVATTQVRHNQISHLRAGSGGENCAIDVQGGTQSKLFVWNNRLQFLEQGNYIAAVQLRGGSLAAIADNSIDSARATDSTHGISFHGILVRNCDSAHISGNRISRICIESGSSAVQSLTCGIRGEQYRILQTRNNLIAAMQIHTRNPASVLYGLSLNGGITLNSNNRIGLLHAPQTPGNALAGVHLNAGNHVLANNTVVLEGKAPNAQKSAALWFHDQASGSRVGMMNNILLNVRQPGDSASWSSAWVKHNTGLSSARYDTLSDCNFLYSDKPSARNLIYYNLTQQTGDSLICAYISRSSQGTTTRDLYSVSGPIQFHKDLEPSEFLFVRSDLIPRGGKALPWLTTDCLGNERDSLHPGIGAWESEDSVMHPGRLFSLSPVSTMNSVYLPDSMLRLASWQIQANAGGRLNALTRITISRQGFLQTDSLWLRIAHTRQYAAGILFGAKVSAADTQLQFLDSLPLQCADSLLLELLADASCNSLDTVGFLISEIRLHGHRPIAYTATESYRQTTIASRTETPQIGFATDSACPGVGITLWRNGGRLSQQGVWRWYYRGNSDSLLAEGDSLHLLVERNISIGLRGEGPCDTGDFALKSIVMFQLPTAASIRSSRDTVCSGMPIKLLRTGGNAGYGGSWHWALGHTDSIISSGDSLSLSLLQSDSVFLYARNPCATGAYSAKPLYVISGAEGEWTGIRSENWGDSMNWCGGKPGPNSHVRIRLNGTHHPRISEHVTLGSLTIDSGCTLTLDSGIQLQLQGDLVIRGQLLADAAALLFIGNQRQQLSGKLSAQTITLANPAGLKLSGHLLTRKLVLDSGVIHCGGDTVTITETLQYGSRNALFRRGWINGTFCRHTQVDTGLFDFPVGDSTNSHLGRLHLAGLTPTGRICAAFRERLGSDSGFVAEEFDIPYNTLAGSSVWKISPEKQPDTGSYHLELYFHDNSDFSLLSDRQFSIVRRHDTSYNAADWQIPPGSRWPVDGPGILYKEGYARRENLSGFSQFAVASSAGVLPMQLLGFRVEPLPLKRALLSWNTATEYNSAYFGIEAARGESGKFQVLGQVPAAGYSYAPLNYHFPTGLLGNGMWLFRLRLTDRDGSHSYSAIRHLSIAEDAENFLIRPNPFTDAIHFLPVNELSEGGTLLLSDISGRMHLRHNIHGAWNIIDTRLLPVGLYFYTLVNQEGQIIKTGKLIRGLE